MQRLYNLFAIIDYWLLKIKLARTNDINIFKRSVLTAQIRKNIEDLKPKMKYGKEKIISAALNRQNLKTIFISSGRLLHPPSSVLTAFGLPSGCPS